MDLFSRAIRPAYEGIETLIRRHWDGIVQYVARSAPPMRGLKLWRFHRHVHGKACCRAIRPAYEGIETGSSLQFVSCFSCKSRDPPRL